MVDFPSFSEGLSLRVAGAVHGLAGALAFPFLFGGTFIEGREVGLRLRVRRQFPFLFGGTFIEGC